MSITTKFHILEAGKVRRDAGAFFGEAPFEQWYEKYVTGTKDSSNDPESFVLGRDKRIALATNVLVVETESQNILIDTGTPVIHEDETPDTWSHSQLRRRLLDVKLSIKAIHTVILTSPDIDHSGGLTHIDRAGHAVYAFPHACVYFHDNPQQRQRPSSIEKAQDAWGKVLEENHVAVNESTEVAPGIIIHPSWGPSFEGAVVEVNRGADRLLYLGDLAPTVYHLHPLVIPATDDNPELTYTERTHWLQTAVDKGYKIAFGHGGRIKYAWVENGRGGLAVRPILK